MKLAIIVPYKDRRDYLQVFLELVPKYLEQVNGLKNYRIYLAEQTSSDTFNLSVSRNVGAEFALADDDFEHLIFHDVDTIPIKNIDYRPRNYNVAWFMSAGTCKLQAAAYRGANGYNPHFVGWGDEDKEFYHRLSVLNFDVQEWHRSDEAKDAVMANLEWPTMSEAEAFNRSKGYFGHGGLGPRFVPYASRTQVIGRCDKKDFFNPVHQQRNARIWEEIYAMPLPEKIAYIQQNGLNLVDLAKIVVRERTSNFVWVAYETADVLGSVAEGAKGRRNAPAEWSSDVAVGSFSDLGPYPSQVS